WLLCWKSQTSSKNRASKTDQGVSLWPYLSAEPLAADVTCVALSTTASLRPISFPARTVRLLLCPTACVQNVDSTKARLFLSKRSPRLPNRAVRRADPGRWHHQLRGVAIQPGL